MPCLRKHPVFPLRVTCRNVQGMDVLPCRNKLADNGIQFGIVDVGSAKFGHKHSASDVYADQVRAHLSVYRVYGHRGSYGASGTGVYVRHYGN